LDLLEAAIEPDSISGFGDRFDEWQEQGTQRYGLMVTEHWLLTYSWEGEDAVAVDFEWIN
jgi:plasmid maintenance system killer protein